MAKRKSINRPVKKEVKKKEVRYELITEEELLSREIKYAQRLYDIDTFNSYVNDTLSKYTAALIRKLKNDRWLTYLLCENLPEADKPQQTRLFIAKIQHFDRLDIDKTIDWTLEIDERSILSQDIDRIDVTRSTLSKEKCSDMSGFYEKDISNILRVLSSMDTLLENDATLGKMQLTRTKDLVLLKTEIEIEIGKILDTLTYRILSSKDAYMTSKDGFISEYCYKGNDFQLHLWALRNTPKRFKHMEFPYMISDMSCTGVKIQMPLNCLYDEMAIRCVHTNFDFCTLYAKSFELIIDQSTDYITAGLTDMADSLAAEWKWQLEIIKEIQDNLHDAQEAYDIAIEKIIAKFKNSGREAKKLTEKHIKQVKAPTTIPQGMVPDAYKIFLERSKSEFESFFNESFIATTANLQPDEINLRKYIIIGGIYEIHYVRAPKHTDFNKFNITFHDPERQLNILKDIVTNSDYSSALDESKDNTTFSFLSKRKNRSVNPTSTTEKKGPSELDRLSRIRSLVTVPSRMKQVVEPPCFHVTFNLPGHLCKWGLPLVCQFEDHPTEVQEIFEIKPEVLVQSSRQSSVMRASSYRFDPNDTDDNDLAEISEKPSFARTKSSISVKRMMDTPRANSINIFSTPLATHLRQSLVPTVSPYTKPRRNFSLDKTLSPAELLIIKRECIPQIISSFKFPSELKESQFLETKNTNKSKLVRKQDSSDLFAQFLLEKRASLTDFSFDVQDNPERLFPILPEPNISYGDLYYQFQNLAPNTVTLFDFLDKLNVINEQYRTNKMKFSTSSYGISKDKDKSLENFMSHADIGRSSPNILKKSLRKSLDVISILSTESSTKHNSLSGELPFTTSALDREAISTHGKAKSYVTIKESTEKKKKSDFKKIKHWTDRHIFETIYDYEHLKVTVKTDRLGIFGLAYKRYEHFPFRGWSLDRKEDNPEEYLFTLNTFHVQVLLTISSKGYSGYVTDLSTRFVAKPFKYLSIEEPISDINDLKKLLLSKNINIFCQPDAYLYIENGYAALKHVGTENHVYDAMALHCPTIKFSSSSWNRLAALRDLVLCLKVARERDENLIYTVRVTPEQSTFVEISELCSDNVDEIILKFTPTWRNISTYSDLHSLIQSICSIAVDERNKNPMLLANIQGLLKTIRPLSNS